MIFELLIAGGALIAAAMVMQKVVEQGSFQALIAAFLCIWCTLTAMYYWNTAVTVLLELPIGFKGRQAVLVGFWLAFLAAAVPHIVLLRLVIRNYRTTFPPLVDYLIQWGGALLVGAAVFCFIIMSVAIAARSSRDFNPARLKFRPDLIPMRVYLWTARRFPPPPDIPPATRLPKEACMLFLRR